jgi:hypothetical protein
MLVPARHFYLPSLFFGVRLGVLALVERLKSASLGKAPALLANTRLGWKSLPGTHILAYYKHLQITDIKSFITLVPCGMYYKTLY